MSRTDSEADETARLILMEDPEIGLFNFKREVDANLERETSLREITDIWAKYRGFDGRTRPTHDYVTGRPLR